MAVGANAFGLLGIAGFYYYKLREWRISARTKTGLTSNFTYADAYAPNADGNCDSNSHSDSNTNGYRNSDANGWAAGYAHSKVSSYSAAAPVALPPKKWCNSTI